MDRVRKQLHVNVAYRLGLTGKNVNVCVLDTGIFLHRDLENSLLSFVDFTDGGKSRCRDDNGHGTHVCGILAGSGRASRGRYQGIAPGAGLVVGKILDQRGKGQTEDLFRALEWILNNHKRYRIRIVNISVGISEGEAKHMADTARRESLHAYLHRFYDKGILVVTAAGNLGPAPNSLSVLGESAQTICVGCHDGGIRFSDGENCEAYSGRGPSVYSLRKPDVVAPGTQIAACSNKSRIGYVRKSGTSMACPIVSGLAALVIEREPNIGIGRLMAKLRAGTVDLNEAWSKQGYGMIDAEKLFS